MHKDKIVSLVNFMNRNKENPTKTNLLEYLQERICLYAGQEQTPAEQVKGMNRLLKDIRALDNKMFEG